MNRAEKLALVEDFRGKLSDSPLLVLADYRGISVEKVSAFRDTLRAAGMEYRVVKNTLALRAVADTEFEPLGEMLSGMTGWVFSNEDAVASAKVLRDAIKEAENIDVKGGFMEGDTLDAAGIKQVADLPSREEMLAQVLGTILAAPRQVLGVLNAPGRDLVNILRNYETKISEGAE